MKINMLLGIHPKVISRANLSLLQPIFELGEIGPASAEEKVAFQMNRTDAMGIYL